jgi:hypothetical protein
LVEFSGRISVGSLQRIEPEMKEALASIGEHCDFLERQEAIILELRDGRIVLYDTGTMHGRFRDVDLGHAADVLALLARQIAALPTFSAAEHFPLVDTDIIFRIKSASNVMEQLARYLKREELSKDLWSDPRAIKATGLTLFLTDPKEKDCIRVHIGPHRDDPFTWYYVRVSRVIEGASVGIDDLKDRVLETLSFLPDKLWGT